MKQLIKKMIPARARQELRKLESRFLGLERDYKHMSTEQVFDEIYTKGLWGKDDKGLPTSGSGSHTDAIVMPYVHAVKKVVDQYPMTTAVDLGCGDFAVGSRLYDQFDHYTACDISSTILERNRQRFDDRKLAFKKVNLAEGELPPADVAFVREVLQHLSNREIASFVDKLHTAKPYKYLVVTEHLPIAQDFAPNADKPSGPNVRVGLNSGIVLHEAPFSLRYKEKHDICSVEHSAGVSQGVVKTTLYVL